MRPRATRLPPAAVAAAADAGGASAVPTALTVTQTATQITIDRTIGQGATSAVYKLDASESTNLHGDVFLSRSRVSWDGPKLVITTRKDMGLTPNGPMAEESKEVLSLEGGVLTIVSTTRVPPAESRRGSSCTTRKSRHLEPHRSLDMNRRNFLRASASPVLAPLVAPKLASVFEPLRVYAQETAKSDQLIITKIEPYVIRVQPVGGGGRGGGAVRRRRTGGEGGGRGYPCVRIETAEGIHGWGEGTTPPTNPAVMTQIRESGKLLMGKSAWDIEGHWTQMYTTEFNTLGGTLFAAMSAIDIALWDIVGKKLGFPSTSFSAEEQSRRKSLRIYASAAVATPNGREPPTARRPRKSWRKARPPGRLTSSAARRSIGSCRQRSSMKPER